MINWISDNPGYSTLIVLGVAIVFMMVSAFVNAEEFDEDEYI